MEKLCQGFRLREIRRIKTKKRWHLGRNTRNSKKIELLNPKTPSIQIVPTLGSKVFTWYLLWAIWSRRGNYSQTPKL